MHLEVGLLHLGGQRFHALVEGGDDAVEQVEHCFGHDGQDAAQEGDQFPGVVLGDAERGVVSQS